MLARLLDFIFPPRDDEGRVRALSEEEFLRLLDPKLVEATRPAAHTLLPFADKRVRAVIHEAKYHGNEQAFVLLSSALVEYLRQLSEEHDLREARLVPIPLGVKRLQERGFNQVETVARRAAKELEMPVESDLLVRTRETASQVSLPRQERKENMRGAFSAARTPDPKHLYVLLDDVTTTGATLQAAIDALKSGGAQNILPVALAH